MIEIAKRGRIASRSAEAKAKESAAQEQHHAARRAWVPSSLPTWLTQEFYRDKIMPRVAQLTVPQIAETLNVSEPYAARVSQVATRPTRTLGWIKQKSALHVNVVDDTLRPTTNESFRLLVNGSTNSKPKKGSYIWQRIHQFTPNPLIT
jgi:hypothetical protein